MKWTGERLEGAEIHLDGTKAGIDRIATDLERMKMELNSKQTARTVFEVELATTREALVASNKKLSSGPTMVLLLLFFALNFLLWSIYLLWSIWTGIQILLAVLSRIC